MGSRSAARPHPLVAAGVWLAGALGASYLLDNFRMDTALRAAVALLPVPCFLFFVWAFARWYRQADELQQHIQLTAWVHALVGSLLGAILLYYMQKAFFPVAHYPTLEYFGDVMAPAAGLGYLVGYFRATRRYA